jgi:magnesium transporter
VVWLLKYNSKNNTTEALKQFAETEEGVMQLLFFESLEEAESSGIYSRITLHELALGRLKKFSDHPRINIYKDHAVLSTFIITDKLELVAMNLLASSHYVICICEKPNGLRQRLEQEFSEHPEHMKDTSKVLYHVLNETISSYLNAVDRISDEVLALEKRVFVKPFENDTGHNVFRWKERLVELRQVVESEEGVLKKMVHKDFPFATDDSGVYFEDLVNTFSRVPAALDSFKENLQGIFDLQISLKSDHMNRIMKTLTLVSVIFVPLTFIAGLYGMNFEYMPELGWRYGYFAVLAICVTLGASILFFFKKRGWW